MSTPFLGQLKIVAFGFAPQGWALCNGQILPISQFQALFSLLGITYGGDGESNFGLPNLQGRVPVHVGSGLVQGPGAGEVNVTLDSSQIPVHNHAVVGVSANASASSPAGNMLATTPAKGMGNIYGTASDGSVMAGSATSIAGESQPHENRQPFLALNFIIALQGIFPSRQ